LFSSQPRLQSKLAHKYWARKPLRKQAPLKLAALPVSQEVRQALSEQNGRFNHVYDTVLCYERGDWPRLTATLAGRIDAEEHVPAGYLEATKRASQVAV
jgi:c-di-GMP-related signal transduction protein